MKSMHMFLHVRSLARVVATAAPFVGSGGCEAVRDRLDRSDGAAEPTADETKRNADERESEPPAAKTIAPDARDPAGAVALLAALCDHAAQGDHAWVTARVTLPLVGIHSINAKDEDPLVHPNEEASVENFQHTSYCRMLPAPGTVLREYEKTATRAAGIVDFGKVPHRVEFDLGHEPPRLIALEARVLPRPIPPKRTAKVREYELVAPPIGFTDKEPPGAVELRREVIDALQKDPRCIEDYVARETTVARFRVVVEKGGDGRPSVRVEPFQLVRASLLSCLRTQVPALPGLAQAAPTSAIVELIIPVALDETDPDTPTVVMESPK